MERVDDIDGVKRLFRAKAERRRSLAALPFPEKVAAVVKLQEMAAPILQARGRTVRPWRMVPDSPR
ncbi:hypothetical protein BH20VER2_BH20VER2_12060 [soil metagenome]